MTTILYPEPCVLDTSVERTILGPDVHLLMYPNLPIAALPDADCAIADALMVMDDWLTGADLARFPRLRLVVRMAVGYDRIDRAALARRGITLCNVPDYGTTEVADTALAMLLALRRGLPLYLDTQRAAPPAPWTPIDSPVIQRVSRARLGILGLGRIGTAVALRAKAFGMRVVAYDRFQPSGVELALGIQRVADLDALFEGVDAVSLHVPLTPLTRGMVGLAQLRRTAPGAVVINTARGGVLDLDAVETLLREGHLAGAGLDVLPVEPVTEPPPLMRAYQAREPWLEGRLIITPHAAYRSPQSWDDIRRLSAETVASNLLWGIPRNVIPPEES